MLCCAVLRCVVQLLDSRNRQELSVDMLALSKLRLEPGDQWLDEYFDATEAQLGRFTLRVRPGAFVGWGGGARGLKRTGRVVVQGGCVACHVYIFTAVLACLHPSGFVAKSSAVLSVNHWLSVYH